MDNKVDNNSTATQDPSMEQILQTIRGVITDEEEAPLELTEPLKEDASLDVLTAIDSAIPGEAAASDGFGFSVADIVPKKEVIATELAPKEEDFAKTNSQPIEKTSDKPKQDLLISERSAEDTSNTIKSFMKSVSKPASDGLSYKAGNTVEDLIIEMVKPHLKDWLDKNLPTIVKQIVEKEINKLIPREDD